MPECAHLQGNSCESVSGRLKGGNRDNSLATGRQILDFPVDFKSLVSTNFTTRAEFGSQKMEAGVGIEPAYTELQSAA